MQLLSPRSSYNGAAVCCWFDMILAETEEGVEIVKGETVGLGRLVLLPLLLLVLLPTLPLLLLLLYWFVLEASLKLEAVRNTGSRFVQFVSFYLSFFAIPKKTSATYYFFRKNQQRHAQHTAQRKDVIKIYFLILF